jgi:hypothetical protein
MLWNTDVERYHWSRQQHCKLLRLVASFWCRRIQICTEGLCGCCQRCEKYTPVSMVATADTKQKLIYKNSIYGGWKMLFIERLCNTWLERIHVIFLYNEFNQSFVSLSLHLRRSTVGLIQFRGFYSAMFIIVLHHDFIFRPLAVMYNYQSFLQPVLSLHLLCAHYWRCFLL